MAPVWAADNKRKMNAKCPLMFSFYRSAALPNEKKREILDWISIYSPSNSNIFTKHAPILCEAVFTVHFDFNKSVAGFQMSPEKIGVFLWKLKYYHQLQITCRHRFQASLPTSGKQRPN